MQKKKIVMKLLFEAIRAMPAEWVDDKTQVTSVFGAAIVAIHPERPPMVFCPECKAWEAIPVMEADSVEQGIFPETRTWSKTKH
jgi:hypothetical protein